MSRNAVGGLASIVIPCWNQLEFTRQCIAALLQHTRSPWELIVVDNGSNDGTGRVSEWRAGRGGGARYRDFQSRKSGVSHGRQSRVATGAR